MRKLVGHLASVQRLVLFIATISISKQLFLPYLTLPSGWAGYTWLHLPSAEAVSVRPNAQPRCNHKVTVIGCEAETSAVKPNKSPAIWD